MCYYFNHTFFFRRSLYTDAVLSRVSRDAMFARTIPEYKEGYYGYGWKIDTKNERNRVSHNGGIAGFVAHFARYPDERVTIVVLTNLQTSSILKIEKDLAAIIFDQPCELPKQRKAIEIDPAIYENYVGQYESAPSPSLPSEDSELVFKVTIDSQRIFIQMTGQEIVEIFPESPTEFFLKIVDAQLTFIDNDEGKKSQVILHQHGRDRILNKID